MRSQNIATFVVDWGTSNFRLFGLDSEGTLVSTIEAPLGVLQIKHAEFAEALEQKLKEMTSDYQHKTVVMAGMVGSASGWFNVPYVKAKATVSDIAKNALLFQLPWGAQAYILPGVSYRTSALFCDVMRGEEVQIFGLSLFNQSENTQVVLPGTHSKHVFIENGAISRFSTYFTGELYALLSQYSSVKPPSPAGKEVIVDAFLKGVKKAAAGTLLNDIFSARALRLFGELNDNEVADYLSGILIGNELQSIKRPNIYLVGGEALCQRYELAARQFDIETHTFSGNTCFLHGMSRIVKELSHGR
ncbi:2-dehydro-3-deoxygalactonokinase [Alteromonas stellipolaris]|uniref:2-dehydro-3-deoxygalactonokinase n=1 Tax=Alteromonas stellipolaris TaxID=233316 RepID=UPI0026E1CBE3|nr:2-dehydro-3-deoxygalactonokinase [Alteromonas stellipolaris]MDO6535555.1 2-dehydro-3-deoxygalactonokinase [Alteromonas stellipolaris]MDO6627431.1 2-dehydro-3-deoxygalactonokinase [Alteromonas stellipolaris]